MTETAKAKTPSEADRPHDEEEKPSAEEKKQRDAEERTAPPGSVVYEAILAEGITELRRGNAALWWSGVAAGLSMGFSLVAEGLLEHFLPAGQAWTPLITKLGYSVGFIIVVLGRQQLFTENTLTAVLPFMNQQSGCTARDVGRLWAIVLAANLAGAAAFSFAAVKLRVFEPEVLVAFARIGKEAIAPDVASLFVRGIFAGWLIALMVWLLPYAESARVAVIVIVTYLIGLGHFPHIIAGSIEVMVLAALGETGWFYLFHHYMIPTLLGNILGGVALVAALNHAQAMADDDH